MLVYNILGTKCLNMLCYMSCSMSFKNKTFYCRLAIPREAPGTGLLKNGVCRVPPDTHMLYVNPFSSLTMLINAKAFVELITAMAVIRKVLNSYPIGN